MPGAIVRTPTATTLPMVPVLTRHAEDEYLLQHTCDSHFGSAS